MRQFLSQESRSSVRVCATWTLYIRWSVSLEINQFFVGRSLQFSLCSTSDEIPARVDVFFGKISPDTRNSMQLHLLCADSKKNKRHSIFEMKIVRLDVNSYLSWKWIQVFFLSEEDPWIIIFCSKISPLNHVYGYSILFSSSILMN